MTIRPASRRIVHPALVAAFVAASLSFGADTALAQGAPNRAAAVRVEALEGDYVTLGRANLRQQPSQQGARLGQIDAGVKLRVTGKVADAPWYAVVAPDGRTGYVFADLLRAEEPAAAGPATVAAPASSAAPANPSAAAQAVGDALTRRLDAMEATLNSMREQIRIPTEAVDGMAGRQQALEKAIEGLRADIAGLRGGAAEGDKSDGLIDRLLKLQDQIAAQVGEQRAEVEKLARRLDRTEEWLKPLGEWSGETWNKVQQQSDGWTGWLWNGYSGLVGWLTQGWWWQAPAAPATGPAKPAPAPSIPGAAPEPAPAGNRTIMGELVRT